MCFVSVDWLKLQMTDRIMVQVQHNKQENTVDGHTDNLSKTCLRKINKYLERNALLILKL